MRVKNFTTIPDEMVREIIRHTLPSGVKNFDVRVSNLGSNYGDETKSAGVAGRAYRRSRFHDRSCPFVVCRIDKLEEPSYYKPYQLGQHKGKQYWLYNRAEKLVVIMAHELRHLWQYKQKNKRGYVWGSRGKSSEVDTEAYAINRLRAWRKR